MKILAMSGFVPEHICDTVRFTQYTGDRSISHYCGYASDFISQVWHDNSIDGAVFPKSCDSTRSMKSYLDGCGKFLFQLHVPSCNSPGALECFAGSIRAYKEAVEAYYGIRLNNINDRIDKINKRNGSIRKTYENLSLLPFADYLEAVHSMLQKPLMEQGEIDVTRTHEPTDKRVFVIGSFLSNLQIAKAIDSAGLTVVGDLLTEFGRLASMPPVETSGDIFQNIARGILSKQLSPTQNFFSEIMNTCVKEVKKKAVKGVLFITQKYCEAYDYLYAACKPELDELGVASARIVLTDTEDSRKAELVLEAFADTI